MEISIPEDLKERMREFPAINWSHIVQDAVEKRLEQLTFMKYFASESNMTKEEAVQLGKELKKRIADRYRDE